MSSGAIHGVNLTGWLTLKSWVTPELFAETGALDEAGLMRSLGSEDYCAWILHHRSNFIGPNDFRGIAARGFNGVKIPVPWYAFGKDGPDCGDFPGCSEYMDNALTWAEEYGLSVVFSLDVRPAVFLTKLETKEIMPAYFDIMKEREKILWVLKEISGRYASRMGFFGVEVCRKVPIAKGFGPFRTDGVALHVLRNFYREAYQCIRDAAGPEPVVILPAAGIMEDRGHFMASLRYRNVWIDIAFENQKAGFDPLGPSGIKGIIKAQKKVLDRATLAGFPLMVGEWSSSLKDMGSQITSENAIAYQRLYTAGQIRIFKQCAAWFYTTWKTSLTLPGWDARVAFASFERGMIVR